VQVEDNLGALKVVRKLTPEVLDKIEGVLDSKPSAASSFR
jgi:hypothetical protein